MSGIDWRTLKPGDRVEVTIRGEVTDKVTDKSGRLQVMLDGGYVSTMFTDAEAAAATWTRAADPLPTEPGARFWGTTRSGGIPRWWFVMRGAHETDSVFYQPDNAADPVDGADVEIFGLVRLPDPEPQS